MLYTVITCAQWIVRILYSHCLFQIVERSVQPQEQVVFRPTQIPNNDIMMKRYPQGPPDFTLNHIAGRDRLMSHTHKHSGRDGRL